ncbi:hypothetical protein DXG01_015143 [Tephrocybe rancida]|nr:hypothetical protein DXG01_015143 [Tephrocybe rancida]
MCCECRLRTIRRLWSKVQRQQIEEERQKRAGEVLQKEVEEDVKMTTAAAQGEAPRVKEEIWEKEREIRYREEELRKREAEVQHHEMEIEELRKREAEVQRREMEIEELRKREAEVQRREMDIVAKEVKEEERLKVEKELREEVKKLREEAMERSEGEKRWEEARLELWPLAKTQDSATLVTLIVKLRSILANVFLYRRLLTFDGEDAQMLLDTVQSLFTGKVPYFEVTRPMAVINRILGGNLPSRPSPEDKSWTEWGLTEELWDLLVDCWKMTPSDRPESSAVVLRLAHQQPAQDPRPTGQWGPGHAKRFRNTVEHTFQERQPPLDGMNALLTRIIQDSESVSDEDDWLPERSDSTASAALKREFIKKREELEPLLVGILQSERTYKSLLSCDDLDAQILLESFQTNGNLPEYLVVNPGVNRILLCLDIAAGLQYLHLNRIVHGDLKGVNVLIDGAGRASLGDFGISSVKDPEILQWASQSLMASRGGTRRWQAPELLDPYADVDVIDNTFASDVYAWAGICYEAASHIMNAHGS